VVNTRLFLENLEHRNGGEYIFIVDQGSVHHIQSISSQLIGWYESNVLVKVDDDLALRLWIEGLNELFRLMGFALHCGFPSFGYNNIPIPRAA
jgi:hypothetical protein